MTPCRGYNSELAENIAIERMSNKKKVLFTISMTAGTSVGVELVNIVIA